MSNESRTKLVKRLENAIQGTVMLRETDLLLLLGDARMALLERSVEVSDGDSVPMPRNERQAELMEKLGYAWLKEHAPHRLKSQAPEYLARLTPELLLRGAYRIAQRRHAYRGQPLWSFISDMTSHGSTYSKMICQHFGWDPDMRIPNKLPERAAAEETPERYLILCRKHSDRGYALWWRPNSAGYSNDLEQAGRYTREEAESIVRGSDRGEELWPESLVLKESKPRQMIDMGDSASKFLWEKRHRDWLRAQERSNETG